MYFNIKKTKITTTESWRSFEVDGEKIEVVADFSILGALVECEGGCEKTIRMRIILGKVAKLIDSPAILSLSRKKDISTRYGWTNT